MRLTPFRIACTALPMVLLPAAGANAQDVPAETTTATSSTHCGFRNRAVRTVGGAGLGAWLGFMVNKIKVSDWSEESRGAPAIRRRNQTIAVGAVAGIVIGNLPFWSRCDAPRSESSLGPRFNDISELRQRQAGRPITREEIARSGITGSVYDLVYSLRRSWLNIRGVNTFNESPRAVTSEDGREEIRAGEPQLVIYLDNVRVGTVGQLRDLPVLGVTAVRYYDPSQATFKWGTGHAHGAIEVLTVTKGTR